jgi:N-acetylmuramoyl-L-alanine amidase
MDLIRAGDHGEPVRDVQHRLLASGLRIDPVELGGSFGPSTEQAVREFQRRRGLPPDGLVGEDTWSQLVEAGYRIGDRTLYLRSPAFRGDDVRELQRMLNALGFDAGKEDGIFGSHAARGLREFQRNVAQKVDGIVGLETVRALERMRPSLEAPGRALVREGETVRSLQAGLAGAVIAVDAGHGPSDPGVNEAGIEEFAVTAAVAEALAAELGPRGARTILLRPADEDPTVEQRVRRANAAAADVCVSLHLGGGGLAPSGAVCCYYGTPTTHSPLGRHLAEAIRIALVEAGAVEVAATHPLAIALLRETRMPAVQVELAVPSDPGDAERLLAPSFVAGAAAAIAVGLERSLGAGAEAAATGVATSP